MVNYSLGKEDFKRLSGIFKEDLEGTAKSDMGKDAPLQLLLFVDKRPSSQEKIRELRHSLHELKKEYPFEFEAIDVGEQPYLAEYFKLIATPTLIKIHPEPRQTLTGTDLVGQLKHWWPRWQAAIDESHQSCKSEEGQETGEKLSINSIASAAEAMQLSDEIFNLKQEREQLLLQLRFKDRIIAMLAHDLRNPLTAASLAIETIQLSENSQNGQGGYSPQLTANLKARLLRQARAQLRAIERMITDILESAKGTNTQIQIQPGKLNLGLLCQEILTELKSKLKSKSLRLETDIPPDLPDVYGDSERVRQVIVNLLDNAIKYTPEKGTINVSILERTSQKVQVSICDSGPGIPEENCDRIFEDNFRLQRDSLQEGYGIGLALCKKIIRSHYGKIWVDSSLKSGSCFHFTLPVYR
jgi:two-component system clock-associated histidine kinase SasA